ncbi:Hsp20/alpha crystallin family protein [Hymenobacter chitinivorans]|uniref:HSP20 family protein n=1 Tax=Hymenobacter chitinivorans DSM 11115 TaxID=1121954 RepID=A0A2M9B556_9BACT|nr:Hsp20/alpha crystallin family protein [Hymenobacter chitinivorans]PJJ53081.1 HSP20 family protein [Hymenobacter chitinivorans DSM 11115]
MAIHKYQDPFADMMPATFSSMLDRFFNDSLAARGRVASFSPQVDAYETEQGYQIEAALSGLKREDIKVDFHRGRLTISGETSMQSEQNQRRYHVVESAFGSFQRSSQLPETVGPSRIEDSFEDGMLRIVVPKDEQKTMRHQIQIRGGQRENGGAQLSGRVSQQAPDVPVQSDGTAADGQSPAQDQGQEGPVASAEDSSSSG